MLATLIFTYLMLASIIFNYSRLFHSPSGRPESESPFFKYYLRLALGRRLSRASVPRNGSPGKRRPSRPNRRKSPVRAAYGNLRYQLETSSTWRLRFPYVHITKVICTYACGRARVGPKRSFGPSACDHPLRSVLARRKHSS